MALSEILTTEILDSYAESCCKIGLDLWTLAIDGKHGHLLMPSRGAHPILWHAKTSFDRQLALSHGGDSQKYLKDKFSIPRFNEIWLPFTALAADDAISTALQRRYWCVVLKSILEGIETSEFRMHRGFVRDVCQQRFDHVSSDLTKPDGVVIIDTVISGRAVTEMSEALDEIGVVNYVFLLAVDENGQRMREPYKTKISVLESQGRAQLYYMENIFTEDSNPGLTGVTAVVFPEITKMLNCDHSCGSTVGFWHFEVSKRPNGMNLPFTITSAITQVAIFRRICALIGKTDSAYSFEEDSYDRQALRKQEALGAENPSTTREFILPVVRRGGIANTVTDVEISSSYIASVYLDKIATLAIAEKLMLQ